MLVIALLYTIVLAVFSLINTSDLPKVEISNSDKIAHAMAYGLLCLIWYFVLKLYKFSKPLLISFCSAIIYGIIIEVLQGSFTTVRTSDSYDILANCIGVVFISIIILIRNKTDVKKILTLAF